MTKTGQYINATLPSEAYSHCRGVVPGADAIGQLPNTFITGAHYYITERGGDGCNDMVHITGAIEPKAWGWEDARDLGGHYDNNIEVIHFFKNVRNFHPS